MQEPKLDLILLDTHNSYTFAVGDISTYPTGYNVNSPTLEISPPSFNSVNLAFTHSSINIYNAYNLGISKIEESSELTPLPDGIYRLKYSIFPAYKYNVEKTFLRTDVIQEKFDRAFLATDIMNCDGDLKKRDAKLLREINFNLQGAIAAANNCANKLALQLYQRANEQIDAFLEQRCYNC